MTDIFESLLPVFLLISIGIVVKWARLIPDDYWHGMERLSFYLFFPALLFVALARVDLGELPAGPISIAVASALAILCFAGIILHKLAETLIGISPASYSSMFQGYTRWNAFVALAIAEKLFGPEGLAVVALVMATVIVPLVIVNISVVGWLGTRPENAPNYFWLIVANPMIIGVLAGLAVSLSGIMVYRPLFDTVELLSRVTLPLGLLLVGAALRFQMPGNAAAATVITAAVKLVILPGLFFALALMTGVTGDALVIVAICGGVPTAMNGYIIAKEMGGDAPLFAAISTGQTAAAFLTLPLVIIAARYFAG